MPVTPVKPTPKQQEQLDFYYERITAKTNQELVPVYQLPSGEIVILHEGFPTGRPETWRAYLLRVDGTVADPNLFFSDLLTGKQKLGQPLAASPTTSTYIVHTGEERPR